MSEYDTHQAMTAEDVEKWRQSLRWPGDGLDRGFARPADVEPLASRLERATRVAHCHEMTKKMLADWDVGEGAACLGSGVWVKGVYVEFLVLTWRGVFLVWSVDQRWTPKQAALVQPARLQIQRELEGWPGQVEAVFHSPREPTSSERHVLMHPETDEPFEIVVIGGRIEQVLHHWRPVGGVGLDPEWITWLGGAVEPRWWRSDEGRRPAPQLPREEL